MQKNRGENIFKSRYWGSKGIDIFTTSLGFIGVFVPIIFITFILSGVLDSQHSIDEFIFLWSFFIFLLIFSSIILLMSFSSFIPFLIIYENGVLIRDQSSQWYVITYLKPIYIPFEQINDVQISQTTHSGDPDIINVLEIYTKMRKIYRVDDSRVSNYREAKDIILKNIKT